MPVRTIRAEEHAAVLALVNESIRSPQATTLAVDDYPLALAASNRDGLFVLEENEQLDACLACLVRPLRTSLGEIRVATIGSVVTHPGRRGKGCSRRLQEDVLARLRSRDVPLAVLWTDRPEYYAGRGFQPAGVEYHIDLRSWRGPKQALADNVRIREYRPEDATAVAGLYARHPYRTVREPGEDGLLYGMAGTRGSVVVDAEDVVVAYLFCGKGVDFPLYGLEWGGKAEHVSCLLAEARASGQAEWALVPQGSERLRRLLVARGAGWFAQPSGLWAVLLPERLVELARAVGKEDRLPPVNERDRASSWLGEVRPDGLYQEGICRVAVWGFDSV